MPWLCSPSEISDIRSCRQLWHHIRHYISMSCFLIGFIVHHHIDEAFLDSGNVPGSKCFHILSTAIDVPKFHPSSSYVSPQDPFHIGFHRQLWQYPWLWIITYQFALLASSDTITTSVSMDSYDNVPSSKHIWIWSTTLTSLNFIPAIAVYQFHLDSHSLPWHHL